MRGLVLDGGGVFGIGQAHILAGIDTSKFDFFCGTSIGSVLSISAALRNQPANTYPAFFHRQMPKIFAGHAWRQYRFWDCRYPDTELNGSLQQLLGSYSFGSCQKPVFCCAANLAQEQLKVFSSVDRTDAMMSAWEVGRCCVAAETYFQPWLGYADGGIYANNPSMVAIASAVSVLGASIEDLELVSIGTGYSPIKPSNIPSGSWSVLSWGTWLLQALLYGAGNRMHEYFAGAMPIKRMLRVQFLRGQDWTMDDPTDMLVAEKQWAPDIAAAIKAINAL